MKHFLSFFLLSMLLISCQSNQDKPALDEQKAIKTNDSTSNQQHREIIEFVEELLYAAGNKNVEAMKEMIFEEALVGNTSLKDSLWKTNLWGVDEIYELYQNDRSRPYLEIVDDYDIILTDRMALIKADATINQFGIPGKREINHITLIRSNDEWKLFSIAWSVHEQPKEKQTFDIDIFARGYAQVWGSKRPEFVAMFYAEDGSLQVNDGKPAKGTAEITNVAKGFMDAFPDMTVSLDSLTNHTGKTRFFWTLTGTNDGPNGTGNKVNISGFEEWTLNDAGLIQTSQGHFDEKEYQRQLEFGTD